MNEQQAFGRLVDSLSPWLARLVFVGGWAFRLYRLHPAAQVPAYRPVATLDADVAFAEGERLEGSIGARLEAEGFEEQLSGNHRPPVSQYTLGSDASGFYAEFLTPLSGSGRRRSGTSSGSPTTWSAMRPPSRPTAAWIPRRCAGCASKPCGNCLSSTRRQRPWQWN